MSVNDFQSFPIIADASSANSSLIYSPYFHFRIPKGDGAVNRSISTSYAYLKLYALTFLFYSSYPLLNVIIPLRSEAIGATNARIGIIMGAYTLTCLLFRPIAGYVVQRYGSSQVLRTLLVANVLLLVLYPISDLNGYIAIRALHGIVTAFFSMALQMGIVDSLPDEERSQGISLYTLACMMPSIIGPIAAVSLWEGGGLTAFAVSMAAVGIATGLLGLRVRAGLPSAASGKTEEGTATTATTAFRPRQLLDVLGNRPLVLCELLMLLSSVAFGAITTFMPLYATTIAGGNAGVYFMVQAGVVVLVRFTLRKKIPSDGKWHTTIIAGLLGLTAAGALLAALSAAWGAIALYASAAMTGIALALLYPTLLTYLTFVLPKASRNMCIGFFMAVTELGLSAGGIAMGPVADASSYSVMYGVCAALAAAAVAIAIAAGRRGGRDSGVALPGNALNQS